MVLSDTQHRVISSCVNIFLMIVGWQVFTTIFLKSEPAIIKYKQLFLFISFTIFALFIEYNFAIRIDNRKDGIILICILIVFLCLIFLMVYFIRKIADAYNIIYESKLIKKQNELQLANYIEINKKYEESRKIIHDIKKHLSTLSTLKNIDDERATEYSRIIEKEVDSLINGFQCSNTVLSVIMSQKILVAESENIKVGTQVEDITFDFISDIDMTAIFANLWDNAIEACLKIEKDRRFINIIIGRVNDFIIISFENSFNGIVLSLKEKLMSTKENHEGVGLSIIRAALEKYDGNLAISQDDNVFKSEILIPML